MGGASPEVLNEMVEAGFKGRKSGAGFYIYDGKKKKMNEAVAAITKRHMLREPPSVNSFDDRQLRLVTRFVNEALLCLQEGVIRSPSDGDIASVFGIGFPPFWGGPFRFVDLYGADRIVSTMHRFAQVYPGEQFTPCQLLLDTAKQNRKFYPDQ